MRWSTAILLKNYKQSRMLGNHENPPTRLLLVFLKEPTPGRVKTRLAASCGPEQAADRYKALVAVLLLQLRGLRGCRVRICYAPDDADDAVRFWILPQLEGIAAQDDGSFHWDHAEGGIDFVAQGSGDLGDRMERQFERGFAEGYEKVAAIGSDCIAMGSGWLNAAFTQIQTADGVVIGPSSDGGYVLLGLGKMETTLFRDMEWSVESVLETTCERAAAAGRSVVQLPPLNDIDDAADWAQMMDGPQGPAVEKQLRALGYDVG